MRRLFVLPALLGLLLLYSFHCRRDDASPGDNLLKGKLVINGPCGNYVVQLLEGHMPPEDIVASWKNPQKDSVYTNVFTVGNSCSFGGNHLAQGDIFTFQLDARPAPQNCALCLIYVATPPVRDAIKNVQKLK